MVYVFWHQKTTDITRRIKRLKMTYVFWCQKRSIFLMLKRPRFLPPKRPTYFDLFMPFWSARNKLIRLGFLGTVFSRANSLDDGAWGFRCFNPYPPRRTITTGPSSNCPPVLCVVHGASTLNALWHERRMLKVFWNEDVIKVWILAQKWVCENGLYWRKKVGILEFKNWSIFWRQKMMDSVTSENHHFFDVRK